VSASLQAARPQSKSNQTDQQAMLHPLFVNSASESYSIFLRSMVASVEWENSVTVDAKLSCLEQYSAAFKYDCPQEYFLIEQKGARKELGMNTPGLLMDRLSILHCKYYLSVSASQVVTGQQIRNIENSLLDSGYPETALLEKEQVKSASITREEQEILKMDLFMALHYSNIAMWINQDLLYTAMPEKASHERLISYLAFFKRSNATRNKTIVAIDSCARRHAMLIENRSKQ